MTRRIECIIEYNKLRGYLLNLEHPKGGPKARFFLNGGFSLYYHTPLIMALERHVHDNPLNIDLDIEPDRFGDFDIIAEGPMQVPDGRTPNVRTVWEPQGIVGGRLLIRLITAMPRDAKK